MIQHDYGDPRDEGGHSGVDGRRVLPAAGEQTPRNDPHYFRLAETVPRH